MRFRLDLQYDGTDYHGWQIQPNARSVEETLETALGTLLRTPIDLVGCGRTDTGVHASHYVAHFDTEVNVDTEQLLYKLQQLVPSDIGLLHLTETHPDFHARFSAISRSYTYKIIKRNDPFLRRYAFLFSGEIDLNAMNLSCQHYLGEHEFSAFCKGVPSGNHFRCYVHRAEWISTDNGYEFHITANRFLRNMVRAIVGTQLEIGRHKLTLDAHRALVANGKRSEAGMSVVAHGLFLSEIHY